MFEFPFMLSSSKHSSEHQSEAQILLWELCVFIVALFDNR